MIANSPELPGVSPCSTKEIECDGADFDVVLAELHRAGYRVTAMDRVGVAGWRLTACPAHLLRRLDEINVKGHL